MGNNYCKQLGIKPSQKVTAKDFDTIWKKYDHHQQGRLNRQQALQFLKNFSQAVGEPYDKTVAVKLFDECDVEKVGWITYSQFKKLFFSVASQRGFLSPAPSRKSTITSNSAPSSPIVMSNSLRRKLLTRSPFLPTSVFVRTNDDSDDEEQCAAHDSLEPEDTTDPLDLEVLRINEEKEVRPSTYEVLPKEQIEVMIVSTLNELSKTLSMPPADVGLLLRLFKWNKDKLFNSYFDKQAEYLQQAGIILPSTTESIEPDPSESFECPVCLDETIIANTFTLRCGHRYCINCWRGSLLSAANSFGIELLQNCKCLFPQCPALVNMDNVKMLADTTSYRKYCYFFNKCFMEESSQYTYCPSECGNAIKRSDGAYGETKIVYCLCGKEFCFSCGKESHDPVTCDQLRNWEARNDADKDAESLKLITAISKPCPKCTLKVDRTEGCNHMTCKCGHQWCWQCRGDWSTHGTQTGGFFYCNKYHTSAAKEEDRIAAKLREENDRFVFYYNGFFVNHLADNTFSAMKETVMSQAGLYKEYFGGEPDFLLEALQTLKRCRHILKFTYVYGFYLPTLSDDSESSLLRSMFELQQAFAQSFCEKLSKEISKPVVEMKKSTVVYLQRACTQYFNNLISFFQNEEEKELYSPKVPKAYRKVTRIEETERWICEKCTTSNLQTISECANCGHYRTIGDN